jgi:hypothetical protein
MRAYPQLDCPASVYQQKFDRSLKLLNGHVTGLRSQIELEVTALNQRDSSARSDHQGMSGWQVVEKPDGDYSNDCVVALFRANKQYRPVRNADETLRYATQ